MSENELEISINKVIQKPYIQSIINAKEFQFQYLLDTKDKFFNYDITDGEIDILKTDYQKFTNGTFEDFVKNYPKKNVEFLNLVGEFISYLDRNASGKNHWNRYDDKRVIAKAMVRQNHWVNHILNLKKNPDYTHRGSIANAIHYSISPMENLTILSNPHRKNISAKILKKEFQAENFTKDILSFFEKFGIEASNRMNYPFVVSKILYDEDVKLYWEDKERDIFEEFKNYLEDESFSESTIGTYYTSVKTKIPELWVKKYSEKFSAKDFKTKTIEKIYKLTQQRFETTFKGKHNFQDFLRILLDDINMLEELFIDYNNYLLDNRKGEISESTINSYVDSARTFLPLNWKGSFDEELEDFKYTYHNIKKLEKATNFKGFSGQMSFNWFVQDLLNKYSQNIPLNQILYGPPGTGKTYFSKELAVNIILGTTERTREDVLESYNTLVEQGQIKFTTFHQSIAYEDFVEGIKPVLNDDNPDIKYEIEKGIFKDICTKAKGISGSRILNSSIDFSKVDYHKMSLGGKNRIQVHQWCLENNKIALGWGDNEDYTALNKINGWTEFRDKFNEEYPYLVESSRFHIQAVYAFQNMKVGDIVVVSLGNHIIDAVGEITGEYQYDSENQFGFHHLREVKWLGKNMNASPDLFIDKEISQMTIYAFNKQDVKIEKFKEYFQKQEEPQLSQDYVLIIDEINRGNISAVFGELITLLEEDKRAGAKEQIELVLPYSKEKFSVPSNVYIIGTMNTADRSVEALDTALRRRFSFKAIYPNIDVLKKEHKSNGMIGKVDVAQLLNTINHRIEVLTDKDHKIGHSYFIGINTIEELRGCFRDKVIPLLEEYFYGDFGKIGMVLGGNFIEPLPKEMNFPKNFEYGIDGDISFIEDKVSYSINLEKQWSEEDFISIYE